MAFGMTPNAGFPPPASEDFPQGLQFQADGVNLGGPDADTVNFGPGLIATRGEGESAGTVTVDTIDNGGGGGGAPTLVALLFSTSAALLNGARFSSWDSVTVCVTSEDAAWDAGLVRFTRTGVYEVTLAANVLPAALAWPSVGETVYGTSVLNAIGLAESAHSRKADTPPSLSETKNFVQWHDRYFVNVSDIDAVTVTPFIYAHNLDAGSEGEYDGSLLISARRVGGAFIEE